MLVSMAWWMLGWNAMASGQSADAAGVSTTDVEAVVSLDGASARLVPWTDSSAQRTLDSLVPVEPREGQIVIVAVVDGSVAPAPAPAPPAEAPSGVEPVADASTTVVPDPQLRVEPDQLPRYGDSGIVVDDAMEPVETGDLVIEIPKDVWATQIEVSCPKASFRKRARFDLGTATLEGVPESECLITFKGGAISTRFAARPGSYACHSLGKASLACTPTE